MAPGHNDMIGDVIETLEPEEIKSTYLYESVSGYYGVLLTVWTNGKKDYDLAIGRTIAHDDPIMEKVLAPKSNLIRGKGFQSESDYGMIVTREFLRKFHYPDDAPFIQMYISDYSDSVFSIPLPVRAVVKELPGINQFAVTPYFDYQRFRNQNNKPFYPANLNKVICYSELDENRAYELYDSISSFFQKHPELEFSTTMPKNVDISLSPGYKIISTAYTDVSYNQIDSIFNLLAESDELEKFTVYQMHDYPDKFSMMPSYLDYGFDYLTINFKNFDKIKAFKDFLYRKYEGKLILDMAQVDTRNNYNLISKLTRILSFILICFCLLSIGLFISNTLTKHLDKIKKNIGTFMAFGISNKILSQIYLDIVFVFITAANLGALALSLLLGQTGFFSWTLRLFEKDMEVNKYFNLFDWWTLVALILIFLISYVALIITTNRLIKRTPGDLIYERE
jgi:hypothetical protein